MTVWALLADSGVRVWFWGAFNVDCGWAGFGVACGLFSDYCVTWWA